MFGFGKKKPKDFFTVVVVEIDGSLRHIVTFMDHGVFFGHGLQPEWIVGTLDSAPVPGESIAPSSFARNPVFVDFLHSFVADHVPQDKLMQKTARSHKDHEWLYIIDQRTPTPNGEVPSHDIIGAFEILNGRISSDSYQANRDTHRILSDDGFFDLGEPNMLHMRAAALGRRNA